MGSSDRKTRVLSCTIAVLRPHLCTLAKHDNILIKKSFYNVLFWKQSKNIFVTPTTDKMCLQVF